MSEENNSPQGEKLPKKSYSFSIPKVYHDELLRRGWNKSLVVTTCLEVLLEIPEESIKERFFKKIKKEGQ